MLDVGRIENFFNLAESSNFAEIVKAFNLGSGAVAEDKARLLWDYINAMADYTSLQGCYDVSIYNIDNRGLSTEYSMGNFGSQTLYGIISGMSETIPITITSLYGALYAEFTSIYCTDIIAEVLSSQQTVICEIPGLSWQTETNGLVLWILSYWNDVNSTSWLQFQELSGLSNADMLTLFTTTNALTILLAGFDTDIKAWYNCPNPGDRCDPMYLAKMQWGQSLVTQNLPPLFKKINILNSLSVTNYGDLSMGLIGTPEYYAFAEQYPNSNLNASQIDELLSFNGLFGLTSFQKFFIYVYRGDTAGLIQEFGLSSPQPMANYLRYMIDLYFFGGLIKPKRVDNILWQDPDPLYVLSLTLNPLLGGNPATNMEYNGVAGNMTQDHYKIMGDDFRDSMDSGESDSHDVRVYKQIGGKPYINFPTLGYFGEGPKGPILKYFNKNPWAEEVPVKGTDAWGFMPFIEKTSKIKFYFDVGGVVFDGVYKKTLYVREFECLRFTFNKNIFLNTTSRPENAKYFQYGPDGVVNETGIVNAPLFGSKPYFLDGDPMLNQLVNYTEKSLAIPELYESTFDTEKYSGAVFGGFQQLQFSTELKPDNLYPKLGLQNLKTYGYKTYMPMFFLQRHMVLSQYIVDEYFGVIHTILKLILGLQICGYVIGGSLLIIFCMYAWKRYKIRKMQKTRSESEGNSGQPLVLKDFY